MLFSLFGFPSSLRNALLRSSYPLEGLASWLYIVISIGYCVLSTFAVIQLITRKYTFLFWFQISGIVAIAGNFMIFIIRQIAAVSHPDSYYTFSGDGNWVLFLFALFWTAGWTMYFARSSRIYSFMMEDSYYLRVALFTRNLPVPEPWDSNAPRKNPYQFISNELDRQVQKNPPQSHPPYPPLNRQQKKPGFMQQPPPYPPQNTFNNGGAHGMQQNPITGNSIPPHNPAQSGTQNPMQYNIAPTAPQSAEKTEITPAAPEQYPAPANQPPIAPAENSGDKTSNE